jgi:hypothetical protein
MPYLSGQSGSQIELFPNVSYLMIHRKALSLQVFISNSDVFCPEFGPSEQPFVSRSWFSTGHRENSSIGVFESPQSILLEMFY